MASTSTSNPSCGCKCARRRLQSKFLHYHPQTLVINNLEFDHADIFEDLKAIENQFHQLIRQIPEDGLIVHNLDDRNVEALVQRGCWSQTLSFAINQPPPGEIDTGFISDPEGSRITLNGSPVGTLDWKLTGVDHSHVVKPLIA